VFFLRRSSALKFTVVAIFAFLGVVFFLINQSEAPQLSERLKTEKLANEKTGGANGATVTLRDFERTESENGKKKWLIKAKRSEYFPERQVAKLFFPEITLFDELGLPIVLTAPEAKVFFLGENGLKEAEAYDGVKINRRDGLQITTKEIYFDGENNEATANNRVLITGKGFKVTAEKLKLNTKTQSTKLLGNVTSVFNKDDESKV
jgi:LPS export ABC transporter protein LptC